LASVLQVYPFAVVQWGLLHLLGESTLAPEVTGWTMVIVQVAIHLVEMRPIKYVLSGGLLMLFSFSFSASISTGQWHSSGGFPCAKPR
jgi:hypothetical protein